jgi:hypothetical protein
MVMHVAVGIHGSDLDRDLETYRLMSKHYFTQRSNMTRVTMLSVMIMEFLWNTPLNRVGIRKDK